MHLLTGLAICTLVLPCWLPGVHPGKTLHCRSASSLYKQENRDAERGRDLLQGQQPVTRTASCLLSRGGSWEGDPGRHPGSSSLALKSAPFFWVGTSGGSSSWVPLWFAPFWSSLRGDQHLSFFTSLKRVDLLKTFQGTPIHPPPRAFPFVNHKIHRQSLGLGRVVRGMRHLWVPALTLTRLWRPPSPRDFSSGCVCQIKCKRCEPKMSGSKRTARLTCLTKHFWDGRALLTNAFRLFARSPSITSSCLPTPSRSFICVQNPGVMGMLSK